MGIGRIMSRLNTVFPALLSGGFLALSGCTTASFDLETHGLSPDKETTILMFKSRVFDGHGRPVFKERIYGRPAGKGDLYLVVYYQDDVPVLSYDVLVAGKSKEDLKKAFEIVSRRADQGAEIGFDAEFETDDFFAWLFIEPIVKGLGAVTGVLIGTTVGSVEAGAKKLFVSKSEVAMIYTEYEYDGVKRLRSMRVFARSGDRLKEKINARYLYSGDGDAPYKTEISQVNQGPAD
jgi:hypothetical protein